MQCLSLLPSRAPADLQERTRKRLLLAALRAQLARLDRSSARPEPCAPASLPLGLEALDRTLPGQGLAQGVLHELWGEPHQAAALGFGLSLLGRFSQQGPVVWIAKHSDLYGPGLAAFDLAWRDLLAVTATGREARLWALEEALRNPGVSAALAEIDRLTLTQSRRLQLAAESSGTTAFVLRPSGNLRQDDLVLAPSAAWTRWWIRPLPRAAIAAPVEAADRWQLTPIAWQLDLLRCRGGQTGSWQIAWQPASQTSGSQGKGHWHEISNAVPVVANPRDRSDQARSA